MATTADSAATHIHPRKALIIGNNSYTRNPLKNCVNDANDLDDKLRTLDFQVKKGINCTREKLVLLIKEFRNSIQQQDLVLFYFAGHGVQYNGQNFLLPVDAEDQIEEDEDIETTSINAQITLDRVAVKTSYITILILDCCRIYKLPSDGKYRGGEAGIAGLHDMKPPWGSLIQFASGPGSIALDVSSGNNNGLYTKHLLKHIDTPNVDLESILKIVNGGVFLESHRKQIPQYVSTIMIPEPIYLNKQDPKQPPISGNAQHILLTNEQRNLLLEFIDILLFCSYFI